MVPRLLVRGFFCGGLLLFLLWTCWLLLGWLLVPEDSPVEPADPEALAALGSHGALCAMRGRGAQTKKKATKLRRDDLTKQASCLAKGETKGHQRFAAA